MIGLSLNLNLRILKNKGILRLRLLTGNNEEEEIKKKKNYYIMELKYLKKWY